MTWADLTVVAARSPGDVGVVIDPPIVRDREGRLFRVRDVGQKIPLLDAEIAGDELERAVYLRTWVKIPSWPARHDHVVVVLSPRLWASIDRAGIRDSLEWTLAGPELRIGYFPFEDACRWRDNLAKRLLEWSEGGIGRRLRGEHEAPSERQIEEALQEAGSLTDLHSEGKKRLYIALALLLANVDPRWSAIADLGRRETGEGEPQLRAAAERLRERLVSPLALPEPPEAPHPPTGKRARRSRGVSLWTVPMHAV
ncbi:MAG: hypothetical protein HYZ53_12740 [Planctomycetes bacterium]|nr:hypothetical protein [Planctomycetota bacterium]